MSDTPVLPYIGLATRAHWTPETRAYVEGLERIVFGAPRNNPHIEDAPTPRLTPTRAPS